MFLCYIPGNVNNLWRLSMALLMSYMQGTGSLEANEVVQDIYDRLPRLGRKCRILVMFADSRFLRRVFSHFSYPYANILGPTCAKWIPPLN